MPSNFSRTGRMGRHRYQAETLEGLSHLLPLCQDAILQLAHLEHFHHPSLVSSLPSQELF